MADFFDELQEDLQEERIHTLWRQWGNYIIGASVLALITAAVVPIWNSYQRKKTVEISSRYHKAQDLLNHGKEEEGALILKDLVDGSDGYGLLATLQLAALESHQGHPASKDSFVRTLLTKLDLSSRSDPALEGLAKYLRLENDVRQHHLEGVEERLNELTAPAHPFRALALQLKASYFLERGDKAKALEALKLIGEDKEIHPDFRARVQLITNYLQQSS